LRLGITKEWCICVGKEQQVVPMPQPSSVLALQALAPTMSVCMDEQSQCEQRYAGDFFGIGCQQAMDAAHFLSAGFVSYDRGLNDTPKMAALLFDIAFTKTQPYLATKLGLAVRENITLSMENVG